MRATRFGPYELRLSSRELYKFGTKVKLRPQPFQVLSLLLDRPGDVVTREQLRQQLWPSDTFVDFEHSLNTAIKELRGVLNDSATDARFIETLPKLGYRFIFPVEHGAPNGQPIPVAAAVELEATRHPVLTEPAPTLPTPRALTWTWLSLAAAMVLLLGIVMVVARVGVFRHSASGAASAAIKPRPSIAVLGFKNLSRKPDDEWMSTAMAEMLGAELASGQQIRVIPSENIARMKLDLSLAPTDTYGQETLGKIHNHLGTDMVTSGSYLALPDGSSTKLRIVLQVQDTRTGETIAAITEDGTESDLPNSSPPAETICVTLSASALCLPPPRAKYAHPSPLIPKPNGSTRRASETSRIRRARGPAALRKRHRGRSQSRSFSLGACRHLVPSRLRSQRPNGSQESSRALLQSLT